MPYTSQKVPYMPQTPQITFGMLFQELLLQAVEMLDRSLNEHKDIEQPCLRLSH